MSAIRSIVRRAGQMLIRLSGGPSASAAPTVCRPSYLTPEVEAEFWALVEKTDSCWFWRGRLTTQGYGILTIQRLGSKYEIAAQRLSWMIAHGPLDSGVRVFHTGHCGRTCVNPSHLTTGSPRECALLMRSLGRMRSHVFSPQAGENNPSAKLSEVIVKNIRAENAAGVSQRALARKYGVHRNTIHEIIHGRLWGKKESDLHEAMPKDGLHESNRSKASASEILFGRLQTEGRPRAASPAAAQPATDSLR